MAGMMPRAAGMTMPELTPEVAEAVVMDVRQGVPIQTALLANGLKPTSIEEGSGRGGGRPADEAGE